MTYNENGQLAAAEELDGIKENTTTLWMEDDRCRFWRPDGTRLTWEEWFLYMADRIEADH